MYNEQINGDWLMYVTRYTWNINSKLCRRTSEAEDTFDLYAWVGVKLLKEMVVKISVGFIWLGTAKNKWLCKRQCCLYRSLEPEIFNTTKEDVVHPHAAPFYRISFFTINFSAHFLHKISAQVLNDQRQTEIYFYQISIKKKGNRNGVVRIATRYGLEGPGIESRWRRDFRTYPHRLWGTPSLLYNAYRVYPEGKGGRSVVLTTHPHLVYRGSRKRVELYLYSP